MVERGSASSAVPVELLIKGTVRLWPIDAHDPQFRYVRWCTDAVIEELSLHRVIGAVSKGGREGHVTEREAAAKAVRIMQQEFSSDLARSVAAHVYGDTDLPISDSVPIRLSAGGGCAAIESLGSESITERRGDA